MNDNKKQDTLPTTFLGGSMSNIPVSAFGKKTGVQARDRLMSGTAAHISSSSKTSSCISPNSSSIEIIDISDEEAPDLENIQQMTPVSQSSSNSIAASKRLNSINMQVSSAFSPESDTHFSGTNDEIPSYLSDYQEFMGYADSDYSILDMSDSNLTMNTKETFKMPSVPSTTTFQALHQLPSVSSTTTLQTLQQYVPLQPQVEHWNPMPTFPNVPSAVENKKVTGKKRKRCGQCPGCQTKTSCGMCSPCINVHSHQVCKMRKCEQLKRKEKPVYPSHIS